MRFARGSERPFATIACLVATLACASARAQVPPAPPSPRAPQASPTPPRVPAPPPAPATDPVAPSANPSAPAGSSAPPAGAGNAEDLAKPRAASEAGGGAPTQAQAAEEAAGEKPEPTLLMKWLDMEDSQVKVYGWLENSFTGNMNGRPKNGQNFGVNPNSLANQWMGNQYYFIIEKPIEQNDQINFGFRSDNLFGNDWTFNHGRGYFDTITRADGFGGYSPAQYYGEVHLPFLTERGVDVKVGRWYSILGYEQVPAISRPVLSVPYMFNYGQPFTHLGVLTTTHVTDRLNWYNGTVNGWDRGWDARYEMGYIGGINYAFNDDKTNLAVSYVWGPDQFPSFIPPGQNVQPTGTPVTPPQFAGVSNTYYSHAYRNLFTTVITHKWSDKLTQVVETDQGWEQAVPFVNGQLRRQDVGWYSIGNWFLYQFHGKLTGVLRSEVFWDRSGVRTGTSGGVFYEETLGLIFKPKSWLWWRGEARYDWAQFVSPYNDGTRNSQLTLATDIIFLF
jgi:hypothetical protein